MKVCRKCGIEKDESEFWKTRNSCKLCIYTRKRKYRKESIVSIEWTKNYTERNKERINEHNKSFYAKNKKRWLEYSKKHREKDLDRHNLMRRIDANKRTEKLADSYVRQVIKRSFKRKLNHHISLKEIPADLVDIYKTRILTHRNLKQII